MPPLSILLSNIILSPFWLPLWLIGFLDVDISESLRKFLMVTFPTFILIVALYVYPYERLDNHQQGMLLVILFLWFIFFLGAIALFFFAALMKSIVKNRNRR
ncbi:MAG: hypothetical protein ACD_2C00119G0008 [uncultured bacterium (gcode 4)]|uniref:Uncharacterized protein n=1 Tax=uncultured bacterium (gcode 4) TaxID=1234023 RepID=K2G615_9BACT|nr:MAG: hypothetical protein ACD_2C00119G0008 [uncultured bacterium (gcode 4)]